MSGAGERCDAARAGNDADRYRTLFEHAPIAYLITDLAGMIVDANEVAAELLDVDRHFLAGKPIQIFVDPPSQRELRRFVTKVVEAESHHLETRLRRRSGIAFDASIDAVASGAEIRWTIQDVSLQRLAERQLWELNRDLEEEVQRQTAEIATVLEELPIGVVVVDAASRTILRANALAQEAIGVGPGASLETLEGVDGDGHPLPLVARPSALALEGRRVERSRLRVRSPAGVERELEVSAVPLRGVRGEIIGAALTLEDVTVRMRRERAEREFVSNAAHQLRSPLTAMGGAIAVLRSVQGQDEATRSRFLDHIERETDRMVRLTHGLLTLARLDRDDVPPKPSVLPVQPLLAGAAGDAGLAGSEIAVEANSKDAVVANEELLVEALANLVANAVRHGGGRVALRGLANGDQVVLEVADSGRGMSPDVLEHVFDRFYRPEGARAGGFGLGLPIARAAARAAGGELTIESSPGAGTTARIRLPRAKLL